MPQPGEHEVLIRIEATPLNPSDQGLLLGPADLATLQAAGTRQRPLLRARVPAAALPGLAGRLGQSLPVGNEGAGTVVATGTPEDVALVSDSHTGAFLADILAANPMEDS